MLRAIVICIFSLLSSVLFTGCSERWTDNDLVLETDAVEFYVAGVIGQEGVATPFRIEVGPWTNGPEGERFFLGSNLSDGRVGPTLLVGAYSSGLNTVRRSKPRIEFQFWPDNIGGDGRWSAAEVKAYFAVGSRYTLGGEGSGRFGFRLLLPVGSALPDLEPSAAEFLADPTGTLTITEIVDYDYLDIGAESIPRQGLRIKCTFHAEVGRYDLEADQADGNPNFFRTDEVVQFTDGEAVIYVPYDEAL